MEFQDIYRIANSNLAYQNWMDEDIPEYEGEIRCICNIQDDDGFTIQCDSCSVWQHAVCVNISDNDVPDQYLCDRCNPRYLDASVPRSNAEGFGCADETPKERSWA